MLMLALVHALALLLARVHALMLAHTLAPEVMLVLTHVLLLATPAGKWFETTSGKFPHHVVLAFVLYLDGTQAAGGTKGQSTKPISMTLGNFRIPLANQGMAKRTVGYMPHLKSTDKGAASKPGRAARLQLYHAAWKQPDIY